MSSHDEQHVKLRWTAMGRIQSDGAQSESNISYLLSSMHCKLTTLLRRATPETGEQFQ